MTQREQLDQLRYLHRNYRDALGYLVRGDVTWLPQAMVSRVGGMPARMTRLGLIDSSEPMIIVHEIDSLSVIVVTPDQAADWSWTAIGAFPGLLTAFLRKHVNVDAVSVHTPSHAWIRKERG